MNFFVTQRFNKLNKKATFCQLNNYSPTLGQYFVEHASLLEYTSKSFEHLHLYIFTQSSGQICSSAVRLHEKCW